MITSTCQLIYDDEKPRSDAARSDITPRYVLSNHAGRASSVD